MSILQSLKMAWRSIRGNKMRSFLTMLGIIIGVASVIVLVSIGQGSSSQVTSQISSLGTNLITVNITGSDIALSNEDVDMIGENRFVDSTAPAVTGRINVKYGTNSSQIQVTGTNAAYLDVRGMELNNGRFISDIDVENRNKVVVLGSGTAEDLFGFSDPVGESIKVEGTSYKVIGVLTEQGSSVGTSGDDVVVMPLSTVQRLLKSTDIQSLYVNATNEDMLDIAMAQIENTLGIIFPNDTDSYSVTNQQDLLETATEVSSTLTTMLAGIAGISLLVGGIGIMNIMLVSVTERTKEIGIRKAIGAKRKDILLQFLIEAVVLSAFGGLIGIASGVGIAKLVQSFSSLTIALSNNVMLYSFAFSVVVGVVFGVFPANKASKLHPIQALRYE